MKKLSTLLFVLVASINLWATEGALSGKFTINAQGDKIVFSQGNLRATTSDLGEHWTWSFAEHQYDRIGKAGANTAISGNGTVSSNGTVDLFGRSTANTYYGIHNIEDDYQYNGDFVDWGTNAISNGGNETNLWRTLTKDEWYYLFFTRTNAATLFALGSINGVNGTILLPDDWTTPAGQSFTPSTTTDPSLQHTYDSYIDESSANHYADNTYTTQQWAVMESAGAVFLPTGGMREATTVYSALYSGDYASSSIDGYSTTYQHYLYFASDYLKPHYSYHCYCGLSVRLVQAAPNGGATAINTANADAKATKRIVNGQLLIEKNGVRYNALGVEVK